MSAKNYQKVVNIGYSVQERPNGRIEDIEDLSFIKDLDFNKVNPIYYCANKSWLVGFLKNKNKVLGVFCKTEEQAERVRKFALTILDYMEFQEEQNKATENEPSAENDYMSIMLSSGYNLVQELNYFLIKNPIWHWVKYVAETTQRDASGDTYYRVILNRLISEQELEHFKRVILSTGLDCHIYGERYD